MSAKLLLLAVGFLCFAGLVSSRSFPDQTVQQDLIEEVEEDLSSSTDFIPLLLLARDKRRVGYGRGHYNAPVYSSTNRYINGEFTLRNPSFSPEEGSYQRQGGGDSYNWDTPGVIYQSR